MTSVLPSDMSRPPEEPREGASRRTHRALRTARSSPAIVRAALAQALLFGCGAGVLAAAQAGLYAVAAVLTLAAVWIGVAAAWRSRRQPLAPSPPPPPAASEATAARLLAGLLDQTPAPLLTLDAHGALRARNRAARALFRTDDRVLDAPAALLQALERTPAPGRLTAGVGEGEAQRTYAVSLSELQAAGGPMRLAVLLDIEPEVRAAEASALRELMQVLSHEIMNALTPIASLAVTAQELLRDGDPGAAAQAQEAVAVLARRSEGLVRFAGSYRALARLPAPVRAPASLAQLVDEAARLFHGRWATQGVTLSARPPQPDVLIALDADQIMHALLNLLANAAEAALAAGGSSPSVTLAGTTGREGGVVLRVSDDGAGVVEADREHVFQPFFTTKAQGTGVGLSLARQIARAHGGELTLLAGRPGEGATFELRL